MLLCISFAAAAPLNPATYWGYVFINNDTVEKGTELAVETEAGEILAEQTLPFDESHPGSYSAVVNLDDPHTPEDEGGEEGEGLIWYVDGIRSLEPNIGEVILEEGSVNNDFKIIGIKNPEIVASFTHPSKVLLGEKINLTVLLDNQGEGEATVDMIMGAVQGASEGIAESGIKIGVGELVRKDILLEPQGCGQYRAVFNVKYYNQIEDLVDSKDSELLFDVSGADLVIDSLDADRYAAEEGAVIHFTMIVNNIGEEDVGLFNVEIYEDNGEGEVKIDDIEINGALAGELITVMYDYDTTGKDAEKNYNITARITTEKAECNIENNEIVSGEIDLNPRPVAEIVEEEIVEEEVIEEEAAIEEAPVTPTGFISLVEAEPEKKNTLSGIIFLIFVFLIIANLVFMAVRRGNYKMPKMPKFLRKEPEDISVDKVNDVVEGGSIEEDTADEEGVSDEKDTADEKQKEEDIKKNIDKIISKEDGKNKRKELMTNKIAKVRSGMTKKKIERVLIQKGDEKKGSFIPYDYLVDASKIVSFIHNNRKPRYELIEILGKKYPLFLVDLGIKAVYSSKNLEHNYCNKNFDNIKPDTDNYAYVTYWNLVKSVKIMAEKLSLERVDRYSAKELKSILFNKWNKDKPLVAFLYKEFF